MVLIYIKLKGDRIMMIRNNNEKKYVKGISGRFSLKVNKTFFFFGIIFFPLKGKKIILSF
jgi:hypothetical protein